MLKVNWARWSHSKELLREEALKAEHPRTRERLMALYEISEDAVADFQHQINTTPLAISDRLGVKKHIDPEEEKLRFSK